MGRLHGGEAGSGARYDPEGRSEVARADEVPERQRAGVGSARDPLSPNLVDASFSDEGDPLGRLSVRGC